MFWCVSVVLGTVCASLRYRSKGSGGSGCWGGMGSAIFVQINRTLVECRQRVEHFLDGRVAGSATGKKMETLCFYCHLYFVLK